MSLTAKNHKQAGSRRKPTRLTLSEIARIGIENDIFAGHLKPGQIVDEETVCQRFNVSRTPVREAIFQLVQAGLLEKRSRHGATVVKLELRKLVYMFETISELEGLGARLAARRMTTAERKELRDIHVKSAAAMEAGDDDEYAALGRQFHAHVMSGAQNEVLMDITAHLANRLVPYRRYQLRRDGRIADNQRDHEGILLAIEAGEANEAYELMKRHGAVQGDVLADYISLEDLPE